MEQAETIPLAPDFDSLPSSKAGDGDACHRDLLPSRGDMHRRHDITGVGATKCPARGVKEAEHMLLIRYSLFVVPWLFCPYEVMSTAKFSMFSTILAYAASRFVGSSICLQMLFSSRTISVLARHK